MEGKHVEYIGMVETLGAYLDLFPDGQPRNRDYSRPHPIRNLKVSSSVAKDAGSVRCQRA
jgi:hypothetical protein